MLFDRRRKKNHHQDESPQLVDNVVKQTPQQLASQSHSMMATPTMRQRKQKRSSRCNLLISLFLLFCGALSVASNWTFFEHSVLEIYGITHRLQQLLLTGRRRSSCNGSSRIRNNSSKIAEQSMQLRSEPISWVQVPKRERAPYIGDCKHPYRHCCIGQCRQLHFQNDPTDEALFVKPTSTTSQPLANLQMLLEYLEERISRHRRKHRLSIARKGLESTNCNIWFVGDSLASDTLVAAMCQLTQLGYYKITSCKNRFGRPDIYKERLFDYVCNGTETGKTSSIPKNAVGYFQLQKVKNDYDITSSSACNTVTLAFYSIAFTQNNNNSQYEYSPHTVKSIQKDLVASQNAQNDPNSLDGGVIVWNWGINCYKRGCIKHYLKKVFFPFMDTFLGNSNDNINNDTTTKLASSRHLEEQMHRPPVPSYSFSKRRQQHSSFSSLWSILWREHEPQHFNTPGGTFPQQNITKESFRCRSLISLSNWRNVEAWNVFNTSGLLNTIPIVPVFDSHKPLWNQHYKKPKINGKGTKEEENNKMGAGDCTHYCFSPWRHDVTWNGMYHGLKVLDGDYYYDNVC